MRTRSCAADLKLWTGVGVYLNMLNADELDRVVETYGEDKSRLKRIGAPYDPGNLFRMDYNISPR